MTDKYIERADGSRPRLLLHVCCGPCAAYVLSYLSLHFDITLYYYNPNIQPESEYLLRLEALHELLEHYPGIELICGEYEPEVYDELAKGYETEREGGERCSGCIGLRLEKTAQLATELGIGLYCTTLTVSRHKNAQKINEMGERYGRERSVSWLPSDFKKRDGENRSVELAREYGLYRQDYCGCPFSLIARRE